MSNYYHYGKITFIPVKNFICNLGYQKERRKRSGFFSLLFQSKKTSIFNARKNKMKPTLFGFCYVYQLYNYGIYFSFEYNI